MTRFAKSLPSQEYLHNILSYDKDSGIFTWKWRSDAPLNWNRRRAEKVAGHPAAHGYIVIGINGSVYMAHRLAWVYVNGNTLSEELDIDHRDTIKSHNWIENLRPATKRQNGANRQATKGRNLPKGVHRDRNKYRAIIRIDKKNISLGNFDTKEKAAEAYMAAATSYYGQFARRM